MGYADVEIVNDSLSCSFYKNNGEFVGNVLTDKRYITEEELEELHKGLINGYFRTVKPKTKFCACCGKPIEEK